MKLRHRNGHSAVMLAALAASFTVGLAACGSSNATGHPTPPVTVPVAITTDSAEPLSDSDVADMEKQLDEIDQLLAGVDSDLSHD